MYVAGASWVEYLCNIHSESGSFQNWSLFPENNDTGWYPFPVLECLVVIASIFFLAEPLLLLL